MNKFKFPNEFELYFIDDLDQFVHAICVYIYIYIEKKPTKEISDPQILMVAIME